MMKPGDIAIVSGARTPFGRYCGKLKDFTAQELGAILSGIDLSQARRRKRYQRKTAEAS